MNTDRVDTHRWLQALLLDAYNALCVDIERDDAAAVLASAVRGQAGGDITDEVLAAEAEFFCAQVKRFGFGAMRKVQEDVELLEAALAVVCEYLEPEIVEFATDGGPDDHVGLHASVLQRWLLDQRRSR